MDKFYDVLKVEYGRCPPGCSSCKEACGRSLADGISRISSFSLPEKGFNGIVRCNQCSVPECAYVCPVGAIHRSNGVVRVDTHRCVGCGLCTLVCHYAGILFDPVSGKAYKCEMCDQKVCVDACAEHVLSLGQSRLVMEHLGEDLVSRGVPLCQGCAHELALRLALKVFGRKCLFFSGPGCVCPVVAAIFEGSFIAVPSAVSWMTNMSAVMTGVKRYLRNTGEDTTCVGVAGDGMTADVGFQTLSGAAVRNENIIYICLDNEAYMNTGVQQSGTTPIHSWTSTSPVGEKARGKRREPKYMPLIMAMHNVAYVATATVAFPEDYARKLKKAKAVKEGMSYIHVLSPCPTGWRAPTDKSVDLSKMAVETDYFPLWEFENGKYRFTYRPDRPKPLREFTKMMGRFAHLTDKELETVNQTIQSRLTLVEYLSKRDDA